VWRKIKLKKITVQPTIHNLTPVPQSEPRKDLAVRVPVSVWNNLNEAVKDTGYSKNQLVIKALEAFLK